MDELLYDQLERDLVTACAEMEVPLEDLSVIITKARYCQYELCTHPHDPLEGAARKYHRACSPLANIEKVKAKYRVDIDHNREASKAYRASHPRCTCCNKNRISKGNRFLCTQCYENDGDSWRHEEVDQ